MIKQKLHIDKYDWDIDIYYAVSCYYAEEIVNKMYELGCTEDDAARAWENMECGKLDNGITYSNVSEGRSVVVISLASSADEFMNSYSHELRHLTNHICDAHGIDLRSEESCYLTGGIAKLMYKSAKSLMCECVRKKLQNH